LPFYFHKDKNILWYRWRCAQRHEVQQKSPQENWPFNDAAV